MRENLQPPIPARYDRDGVLALHSHFPTIQGEGPFCGERALFYRLAGCNLRCPGCDTTYTGGETRIGPHWMTSRAEQLGFPHDGLVVITGGEPLRQNIGEAVWDLLDAGHRVQIETNGVLWPNGPEARELPYNHERFTIVCSPKTSRIHEMIHTYAAAFKYVLRAGEVDPDDGLPTRALLHPASPKVARPRAGAQVYVQPMDEADEAANALNLTAAIQSTMKHGHRLQLQVHKIINME